MRRPPLDSFKVGETWLMHNGTTRTIVEVTGHGYGRWVTWELKDGPPSAKHEGECSVQHFDKLAYKRMYY
jgi:hypothetical protein